MSKRRKPDLKIVTTSVVTTSVVTPVTKNLAAPLLVTKNPIPANGDRVWEQDVFSRLQVETILCVYEWLWMASLTDGDTTVKAVCEMYSNHGSAYMRIEVTPHLAHWVDQVFEALPEDGAIKNNVPYDWEFVPMVMRRVDWERYENEAWLPDPIELGQTLEDAQAMMDRLTRGVETDTEANTYA